MRMLANSAAAALVVWGSTQSIAARDPSRIVVHALGIRGEALGINNRGDIVGGVDTSPDAVSVPFLWTVRSGLRIISNVPGAALDVNDRGAVVGYFRVGAAVAPRGFLWTAREGLTDLGPAFLPSAINNRGDIAGTCSVSAGAQILDHACRRGRGGSRYW